METLNAEKNRDSIWLTLNHPKAQAILFFLTEQMDNYNAVVCSYQILQEVLKISKDTVRRNIKVLKDNGFITVLKSGISNVYIINDTIDWKSKNNNEKYSKFPANIVLTLSEQEENYQVSFESSELDLLSKSSKEQKNENEADKAEPNFSIMDMLLGKVEFF
jgi:DNA-binding transcriptional ArsR family regulator